VLAFAPRAWRALPILTPYLPWLDRFVDDDAWPAPATWQGRLGTAVVFAEQTEKLSAGVDADDVDGSYPDRCARGLVPSRKENLHDFMNALVWARFPHAKTALATALVAACRARPRDPKNRNRNRLQDRLAMIDEGGLVGGVDVAGVAFGHALLEDAIKGVASRGIVVDVADDDAALAAHLADLR
jgi:hypothetical protein